MDVQSNNGLSIYNQIAAQRGPRLPPGAQGQADNAELLQVLATLTYNQIRYIGAKLANPGADNKEISALTGIKHDTINHWPPNVDRALKLLAVDYVVSARSLLKNALVTAVLVKIKGLESDDEAIRQRVATEIIEWQIGKPRQQSEITATVDLHDYRSAILSKLFTNDTETDPIGADGELIAE